MTTQEQEFFNNCHNIKWLNRNGYFELLYNWLDNNDNELSGEQLHKYLIARTHVEIEILNNDPNYDYILILDKFSFYGQFALIND